MLTLLLLLFVTATTNCCDKLAQSPPVYELHQPCHLEQPPEVPKLESAAAAGQTIIVSVEDARKLQVYFMKSQAWMSQAWICAGPEETKDAGP